VINDRPSSLVNLAYLLTFQTMLLKVMEQKKLIKKFPACYSHCLGLHEHKLDISKKRNRFFGCKFSQLEILPNIIKIGQHLTE